MRTIAAALCACAATFSLLAQTPAFDAASIHSVNSAAPIAPEDAAGQNIHVTPGTVTMNFVSLASCIRWAYRMGDPQLAGGPEWMRRDRFQIIAKAGSAVPEDELRAMMQALLAERFKLAAHKESKSMRAFTLIVAKGGPKLAAANGDAKPEMRGRMQWVATAYTMADLANFLSDHTDSPVIDETGLQGRYDFKIDIAPYFSVDRPIAKADAGQILAAAFQSALQAQLGLKLESRKTPVEVLVVDHAEKPAEN